MNKLKLLQQELDGLEVEYTSHRPTHEVNTASINGHSIIWHEFAMCSPDKPTVEVWFSGSDAPVGHIPINGLRARVKENR